MHFYDIITSENVGTTIPLRRLLPLFFCRKTCPWDSAKISTLYVQQKHGGAGDEEIRNMSYEAEKLVVTVFWATENDAIKKFQVWSLGGVFSVSQYRQITCII